MKEDTEYRRESKKDKTKLRKKSGKIENTNEKSERTEDR
jgi:hypothetical protein